MNHVVDIIDALAAPVAWVVITVIVMRGLPAVIAGLAPNQDVKKVKGGPGGGQVEFYPSPSDRIHHRSTARRSIDQWRPLRRRKRPQ